MNTDQLAYQASPQASAHGPVLRRAAERALLAPSIYNSQPWRLVITADALEIHLDESRWLKVLDSRRRQLTISCGCALFNARVSVAASGHQPIVERMPVLDQPTLLARVWVGERRDLPIAVLDREIERRRTNRRAFMGTEPPTSLISTLGGAARAEGVTLISIPDGQRADVARLSAVADATQRADPDFVAELTGWTTTDIRRSDGVQAMTVPYVQVWRDQHSGAGQIRTFDFLRMGWLPSTTSSGVDECRVLFCTSDDSPSGWLRVGEALQRVWLELTRAGYWASPLNPVVEVRETHAELCDALGLTTEPQILLRIGLAAEVPATPRRSPDDVIVDQTQPEEPS